MPRKPATNRQIADILLEIGLFEKAQGSPFKPQVYELAAKTIEELGEELGVMYKICGRKCIDDLPTIGESITAKIEELVKTGHLKSFETLKKKYPIDMLGITAIEGVGPKTVMRLHKALKIRNRRDLEVAARGGKIEKLKGFGPKSQAKILRSIEFLKKSSNRILLHRALKLSSAIVDQLKDVDGVTHVDVTGSIRRRKETIGDIDLIATTTKPEKIFDAFTKLPQVEAVIGRGPGMTMVRFKDGLDGDLLVLPPEAYGSAMIHFTGSREHNIQIRKLAIKKGWTLSEHGLIRGKTMLAGKTEEEVYKKLGMQWMPPELREGRGEVEVSCAKKIPGLVEYGSLKGDLQVQTTWTDGRDSIETMAKAAQAFGLSYIAITDHTKYLTPANGLDERRLKKQNEEIDRLNKTIGGFRILKGTECDIHKNGTLDLSDATLRGRDLVGISVHSYFDLPKREQTERIIRALKHPSVNVLFHPTGRVVGSRDEMTLDLPMIIRAAKQYRVALEINGSERMDLRDVYIRMAVDAGAKFMIDSDAHNKTEFSFLDIGIAQARRGWVQPKDVLNTLPLPKFLAAIKK